MMNKNWIEIIGNNPHVFAGGAAEPVLGAAVLIPLVQNAEGEAEILFEQRALDLDVQPAEICFPGGGIEDGETPSEAAVRETCEELLLKPEQIRVLGETEGIQNAGIITIHAFLGELKGYAGTYSETEVDHVFTVPVSWFLTHDPEEYMTSVTTVPDEDFPFDLVPGGRCYPWRKRRVPVYFYRHPEGVIWGLTARILRSLAEKLKQAER